MVLRGECARPCGCRHRAFPAVLERCGTRVGAPRSIGSAIEVMYIKRILLPSGAMGTNAVSHPRQCAAHSSRTKERCRKYAIRGARTCRSHGSAASQVRRAARVRMAALVDPSLDILLKMLKPGRRYVKPEM